MSETEGRITGVDLNNLSRDERKELVEAALDRMSIEELNDFIEPRAESVLKKMRQKGYCLPNSGSELRRWVCL